MADQTTPGPRAGLILLAICITAAAILGVRLLLAGGNDEAVERVVIAAPTAASPVPTPRVVETPPPRPVEEAAVSRARPPPREGIHVFPPAGTKPILVGVVVPEDFELPRGYVRHYQSTDDGRELPPILMYHPRQAPEPDWRGEAIPIPPDRVVPPDRIPEGLPIEMLEAPEAPEPSPGLHRLLQDR